MSSERIRELENQLVDLKQRLPAHSVRQEMLMELEELEDELAKARRAEEGDGRGVRGDRR